MKRLTLPLVGAMLTAGLACNVSAPMDPSEVADGIGNLLDSARRAAEEAVKDPLGAKPFPAIIGGDGLRVFYVTNLTDVRVRFPGKTNDLVIPGVGPSNLYRYADKTRTLIRPLVASGAFGAVATDGDYLAYVAAPDARNISDVFTPSVVVTGELGGLRDTILFEARTDMGEYISSETLSLDDGRLAYNVFYDDAIEEVIRVHDLRGFEPFREFGTGRVSKLVLSGDRLAYVEESSDDAVRVVLRDLSNDSVTIVSERIRPAYSAFDVDLALTANTVVWSEIESVDHYRVHVYDIPTAVTRVWAEAVQGRLTGASDDYFITEQHQIRLPDASDRTIVRRYDAQGVRKQLASFRSDGRAGQSRVLGDRAAWVNPDRQIVLAPLRGGDRTIFKPF